MPGWRELGGMLDRGCQLPSPVFRILMCTTLAHDGSPRKKEIKN